MLSDPHTLVGLISWMHFYDFYNETEFPFVTYFDSWDDLADKIKSVDFRGCLEADGRTECGEEQDNLKKWADVLANVKR